LAITQKLGDKLVHYIFNRICPDFRVKLCEFVEYIKNIRNKTTSSPSFKDKLDEFHKSCANEYDEAIIRTKFYKFCASIKKEIFVEFKSHYTDHKPDQIHLIDPIIDHIRTYFIDKYSLFHNISKYNYLHNYEKHGNPKMDISPVKVNDTLCQCNQITDINVTVSLDASDVNIINFLSEISKILDHIEELINTSYLLIKQIGQVYELYRKPMSRYGIIVPTQKPFYIEDVSFNVMFDENKRQYMSYQNEHVCTVFCDFDRSSHPPFALYQLLKTQQILLDGEYFPVSNHYKYDIFPKISR